MALLLLSSLCMALHNVAVDRAVDVVLYMVDLLPFCHTQRTNEAGVDFLSDKWCVSRHLLLPIGQIG